MYNALSDWEQDSGNTLALDHTTLRLRLTGQLLVLFVRPVLWHIKGTGATLRSQTTFFGVVCRKFNFIAVNGSYGYYKWGNEIEKEHNNPTSTMHYWTIYECRIYIYILLHLFPINMSSTKIGRYSIVQWMHHYYSGYLQMLVQLTRMPNIEMVSTIFDQV